MPGAGRLLGARCSQREWEKFGKNGTLGNEHAAHSASLSSGSETKVLPPSVIEVEDDGEDNWRRTSPLPYDSNALFLPADSDEEDDYPYLVPSSRPASHSTSTPLIPTSLPILSTLPPGPSIGRVDGSSSDVSASMPGVFNTYPSMGVHSPMLSILLRVLSLSLVNNRCLISVDDLNKGYEYIRLNPANVQDSAQQIEVTCTQVHNIVDQYRFFSKTALQDLAALHGLDLQFISTAHGLPLLFWKPNLIRQLMQHCCEINYCHDNLMVFEQRSAFHDATVTVTMGSVALPKPRQVTVTTGTSVPDIPSSLTTADDLFVLPMTMNNNIMVDKDDGATVISTYKLNRCFDYKGIVNNVNVKDIHASDLETRIHLFEWRKHEWETLYTPLTIESIQKAEKIRRDKVIASHMDNEAVHESVFASRNLADHVQIRSL
ncbi:hypothetical protein DFH07DRAFT_773154 [Mycena maculata]|uniref:Uncharacterized protein n=1 Tax=Mycena maculata TaxID=230809 RepID=A0AAD7J636_9AGAR|nr:hypothetical protein DFH07DRAFT_773154 [Mycena maculata]